MQKFMSDTGIKIYQASAKSGKNVESSFLTLTTELIDKYICSLFNNFRASANGKDTYGSG